jgi:hypothetical protein
MEEIIELPKDYVVANYKDFYNLDNKNKWIFKVGMEFIIQSYYSNNYEKYTIGENWNDILMSVDNPLLGKKYTHIIKGNGIEKIKQLSLWIEDKKCYIYKDNKETKKKVKPLTQKQYNNRVIDKNIDF